MTSHLTKKKKTVTKSREAVTKSKGGRPSVYRDEFPDLARKFCLLGATNDDLARNFDVVTSTIDKWISEKPEFSGAIKAGREEADANVADRLYARALGYSHPAVKIFNTAGIVTEVPYTEHYPPDTAAAFIWLKNRRPEKWRDKVEVDATHRSDPNALTDQQLIEIIASRRRGGSSREEDDKDRLH